MAHAALGCAGFKPVRVGAGPLLEVLGLLPESLTDSLVKSQRVSSHGITCLPEILLRE